LGVGKSAVSKRLAEKIGARYVSIDRILDERNIWYSGRLSEFLRTNEIAATEARRWLSKGTPVVFDGNFYWKTQITDLTHRLQFPHHIFTLEAPLAVCVERDGRRRPPHGPEAAEQVYAKTHRFRAGIGVDATRSVAQVVSDLVARIR
jgi:predicted kinase